MGRTNGSPNSSYYHWSVKMYHPDLKTVLFYKKYCTMDDVCDEFKNVFSKSQVVSYCSKSRICPKVFEFDRIQEATYQAFDEDAYGGIIMLKSREDYDEHIKRMNIVLD